MDAQVPAALGLIQLHVRTPTQWMWTVQLLLPGAGGIAPHRLQDLHPTAGPYPHSLVISPTGRTLLGQVPAVTADGVPRQGLPGVAEEQRLVLFDVATGRTTATGFTRHGESHVFNVALSGDDESLAVAVNRDSPRGTHLELTVVRTVDLQPLVQRTFPDCFMQSMYTRNHRLQWSPDGRYLALVMRVPEQRFEMLHVLDADTLETVLRVEQTWPLGSCSFSPDSQRLLVQEFDTARVLHLAQERLEGLPWLTQQLTDPPRHPLPLGLLSGDRVVLLRQGRRRVSLHVADLATGQGPVLAHILDPENFRPNRVTISRQWETLVGNSG